MIENHGSQIVRMHHEFAAGMRLHLEFGAGRKAVAGNESPYGAAAAFRGFLFFVQQQNLPTRAGVL